jgi:hypothetical protein
MAGKEGLSGEIAEHLLTILGFKGAEKIFSVLKAGAKSEVVQEAIKSVGESKPNPHGVLLIETIMTMRENAEQRKALKKLRKFINEALKKIKDDRLVNLLSKLLKEGDASASAKSLTRLTDLVSDKEIGLSFDEIMELVERDPLQAAARAKKEAAKKINLFRRRLRAATAKMKKETT